MMEVRPRLLLGSAGDAEAIVGSVRSVTKQHPRVTHVVSVTNETPHWYPSVVAEGAGEGGGEEAEGVEGGGEGVEGGGGEEEVEGEVVMEDGEEERQPVGVVKRERVGRAGQLKFQTLFVQASDVPSTDLLHRFESCCMFIKAGLERGGATLVHW